MMSLKNSWALWQIRIILYLLSIICFTGCQQLPVWQKIKIPSNPPPAPVIDEPRVALVLSSGGFRSAAHLGAIAVLEKHGVPVDLIVGSSAGSFIGAFYAADPNVLKLKNKLSRVDNKDLLDLSWRQALKSPFCLTGPIKGVALQKFMQKNLAVKNFANLKIPLIVVATSMTNNKPYVINSGPLIPAVHASSAMPPWFSPVNIYHESLIDGGVAAPVPVAIAKQYNPKIVIAVDISKQPSFTPAKNAFQLANRALDISCYELAKEQSSMADVVIRPLMTGFGTFDDTFHEEFFKAGMQAAEKMLPIIIKLLQDNGITINNKLNYN